MLAFWDNAPQMSEEPQKDSCQGRSRDQCGSAHAETSTLGAANGPSSVNGRVCVWPPRCRKAVRDGSNNRGMTSSTFHRSCHCVTSLNGAVGACWQALAGRTLVGLSHYSCGMQSTQLTLTS